MVSLVLFVSFVFLIEGIGKGQKAERGDEGMSQRVMMSKSWVTQWCCL